MIYQCQICGGVFETHRERHLCWLNHQRKNEEYVYEPYSAFPMMIIIELDGKVVEYIRKEESAKNHRNN